MSKSIYATVLGEDFQRLHPKIQERFGFDSKSRKRAVGRGIMDRVWHGKFFTTPFLMVGSWRNIMFPEKGENVPFTIENWAYVDTLGRETVTELRTFKLGRERRFDAYMVRDPVRNQVVDYMGTHQHLAVDLHLRVAENGGLRIESGEQRFYEGRIAFKFPMFFSGKACVYVWFDEAISRYRIECEVKNEFWGPLFGFAGTFDVEWEEVDPANIPRSIMPRREESRR
jgi:hypothetical protein